MTKKDYIAIAEAIKPTVELIKRSTATGTHLAFKALRLTTKNIADALASDNSRFDRSRFLRACGLEEEATK